MNWNNLEALIIEAIQRCCENEDDKEAALRYFKNCTVNEMIEEALEE